MAQVFPHLGTLSELSEFEAFRVYTPWMLSLTSTGQEARGRDTHARRCEAARAERRRVGYEGGGYHGGRRQLPRRGETVSRSEKTSPRGAAGAMCSASSSCATGGGRPGSAISSPGVVSYDGSTFARCSRKFHSASFRLEGNRVEHGKTDEKGSEGFILETCS